MKRNEWTHEFPVKKILNFVQSKVRYHEERRDWWSGEKVKAKDEMEKSLELREQTITGGVRHDAVFDQGKQGRYNECTNKVREHSEELSRYASFETLLQAKLDSYADEQFQDTVKVELDVEDIRYFGLHEMYEGSRETRLNP